jgi:hypothetical protein
MSCAGRGAPVLPPIEGSAEIVVSANQNANEAASVTAARHDVAVSDPDEDAETLSQTSSTTLVTDAVNNAQ